LSGEDKVVISHGQCTDGHAAAWLLHLIWPNGKFLFAQPNDKLPIKPEEAVGKDVVIADVCFTREELVALNEKARSLVVLDHHATNRDKVELVQCEWCRGTGLSGATLDCDPPVYLSCKFCEGARQVRKPLDFCKFDMTKSGAGLVFDHFAAQLQGFLGHQGDYRKDMHTFDVGAVMALVNHVEDYDLWAFKKQYSREIHAALSSYPFTFEAWDSLMSGATNLNGLIAEGTTLMRYRRELVDRTARNARERQFYAPNGKLYPVALVNSPVLQSEICEALYKDDPDLIACAWCAVETQDGTQYRYSFRSKSPDGPNVADFAGLWGGGGHAHSAGLTSKTFIFDYMGT